MSKFSMHHISKHIKVLSSLAALLLTFGASGVAVVIHSCTMTPVMECCQSMDTMSPDCSVPNQPSGTQMLGVDMSCSTSTLIGGLVTNPAVVDNNHTVQKASFVAAPAAICISSSRVFTTNAWLRPLGEDISPPSVEKHILNATFLI